jgi:hypothetical protein
MDQSKTIAELPKHPFGIIRGGRMEQFVGKRTTFNATWKRCQHSRRLD